MKKRIDYDDLKTRIVVLSTKSVKKATDLISQKHSARDELTHVMPDSFILIPTDLGWLSLNPGTCVQRQTSQLLTCKLSGDC